MGETNLDDGPAEARTEFCATAVDTFALGEALGRGARGGEVFALTGPLGAGKTQFTKGLAEGLQVPPDEPVVSPTFVLVREYAGRRRLYHLDAYRLGSAEDLLALGFEEMVADGNAVVVVEWADRVAAAIPPGAVWIAFEYAGDGRRVTLGAPPERPDG